MSIADNRAVFLSYASQDAAAVRRMAESLRESGVEVWFDADGGLEHGDEWDAKIRRQIKECVLFIPIISANTQAREEGYFRLEWDLAAERARTIASGVPFILPVVIDDTREPDALVPDRFRMVQWTRLPGGVVTPEVKERYLKLWSHRIGLAKARVAGPATPDATAEPPARAARSRRIPPTVWLGAAAVLAALGGYLLLRPEPKATAESRPAKVEKAGAAQSEAQQLVTQMWALLNSAELDRARLERADELAKRATTLEPNQADAWAAWSQVESFAIFHGYATSAERAESARAKAVRALQIAPQSFEARLAQACFVVRGGGESGVSNLAGQAEKVLRELLAEKPDEPRVLLALGILLRNTGKFPEGRLLFERMAKVPGFAALGLSELGWLEWKAHNWSAADAAADRSIAAQPYWGNLVLRVECALYCRGDLEVAKATLAQMQVGDLQEDFGAAFASTALLAAGENDLALRTLGTVAREWLKSSFYEGPTAGLTGWAHASAGRAEAARVHWETALKAVDSNLALAPKSPTLIRWRGWLLAMLGQREEGGKLMRLARDLAVGSPAETWLLGPVWFDQIALGQLEDAERTLAAALDQPEMATFVRWAMLKYYPLLKPLRGRPGFEAIVARAAANPRLSPFAKKDPTTTATRDTGANSVAVLPFVNQSADKDNEYFSDGVAEELLTVLQKIPGLKVAARTSAWSFKGKNVTLKEVGETLGMAHVVEGSVRKDGNRVKITARLSRAATNEEVWSKGFGPLELTDVFATQSEIATAIVGELRARLTGEATAEIAAQVLAATKGGTKNTGAHEAYLQGLFMVRQPSPANLAKAIAAFGRATEIDESFALAWAAQARAIVTLASNSDGTQAELLAQFAGARQSAGRALVLEPNLTEGHLARMVIQLRHDFDWRGARESLRRASAIAAGDASVIHSTAILAQTFGDLATALASARQALNLDPMNLEVRGLVARCYAYSGQLKEAEREQRRILELSPSNIATRTYLAEYLVLQGRFEEAVAEATQEAAAWGRFDGLALAYWGLKNTEQSDAALARLVEIGSETAAYQIAHVHAFRGNHDAAFQWLERAYQARDSGIILLRTDAFLAPLRSDPRWPEFLKKVGLHDDQLK